MAHREQTPTHAGATCTNAHNTHTHACYQQERDVMLEGLMYPLSRTHSLSHPSATPIATSNCTPRGVVEISLSHILSHPTNSATPKRPLGSQTHQSLFEPYVARCIERDLGIRPLPYECVLPAAHRQSEQSKRVKRVPTTFSKARNNPGAC